MAFTKKHLFGLDSLIESVKTSIQSTLLPSGAIVWFGNRRTAPDGWAICDGTKGTPNLIGRYPLGATSSIGSTVEAGLPNITGKWAEDSNNRTEGGAIYIGESAGRQSASSDGRAVYMHFDASRSNPIYGKSSTVTPPSVKLLPCMKL